MKYINILLALVLIPKIILAQTPAFPGAEGYGKYVTGGRGGDVVYVTHLKDNTDPWGAGYTGSLRAALETSGNHPITIVFNVGGVIYPQTALECTRSNVTIAGQTAPGDGICIKGTGIKFSGNNIIVRYMRFRVSDEILQNDPCLSYSNAKKAIFDHCSFSWSTEENVNITDVDSITLQWCINSESLYKTSHPKGARGYAAQYGGEHSSYHHNLMAHHNSRMPRQNGNTSNDHQLTWDYRNNVHYNWGNSGAFYGGGIEESGGLCNSNLINNYYIPGPATTTSKSAQYFCEPSGGRPQVLGEENIYIFGYGQWYLEGNVMFDNPDKTNNNFSGLNGPTEHRASSVFSAAPVTTTSAEQAYMDVLAYAGATKPRRDSIDLRIMDEVKNRNANYGGSLGAKSGLLDTHLNTKPSGASSNWDAWGIYRTINKADAPLDTDNDGMPDWWENKNGLDSLDMNDGKSLASDNSGYTNLEHYLNSDEVGQTGPTSVYKIETPEFFLYPNPVKEYFQIASSLQMNKVMLFNMQGVLVKSILKYESKVDVSDMMQGYYLVNIEFSNGQQAFYKINKIK